uniref:Uncharacterized protein n=1 Tax=Opuntia streptacantha TaxID=393608 RepID=A0A7C9AY85_OPUST
MVILSQPSPPTAGARQWSKVLSHIAESLVSDFNCSLIKSTSSWLDMQSQIPSQAITMNSSSSESSIVSISGFAVTICSSAGKVLLRLNSMSPMALAKFRVPFTRPAWIKPPAFKILSCSASSSGL